jgi:hypothetical protein
MFKWWPLVWRSTYEAERRAHMLEKTAHYDTKRILGQVQVELHNHKLLLAGRAGTMKKLVEPA